MNRTGQKTSVVCILFAVTLVCSVLLPGCSGWKPDSSGSKYGSSYHQTPDGYYRVREGDTLHAIAFKFGLDWREIARLNGISSPYIIYPDQQLRLSSPGSKAGASSSTAAPASTSRTEGRTVVTAAPSKSASSTTYDVPAKPAKSSPPPAVAAKPPPTRPDPAPVTDNPPDPGRWLWPAQGRVISNFRPDDPARKGIDIGGKEGQEIIASAAGEVVYSGSGLIGYGELVIIKHNERLLSAYAHNQKRLVKEGQKVTAGERIAFMGRNDRNQAMLHFEIRLNGNPQDPLKYLPRQ